MAKKKTDVTDERFVKYDDAQMEELKKIIHKTIEFIKNETRPALDILLPETVEKLTNKFLLQARAEFLADEEAIAEGYLSLADKYAQIEKQRLADEAKAKAVSEAQEKAQREAEEEEIRKHVEEQRAIKKQRDEEDAKNLADLQARIKAKAMGETTANQEQL